jgi:hypothetical protein
MNITAGDHTPLELKPASASEDLRMPRARNSSTSKHLPSFMKGGVAWKGRRKTSNGTP